jgi:hypothetical protein
MIQMLRLEEISRREHYKSSGEAYNNKKHKVSEKKER